MGSVTKWIVLVLVICVFTRNSLGKSGNKDRKLFYSFVLLEALITSLAIDET